MPHGFRLKPSLALLDRSQRSFDKTLRIALNGSIQASEAQFIWSSPTIDPRGYSLANVFASLTIIEDTAPGWDFALIGSMTAIHGSAGARGFQVAVGQGIPIAGAPMKFFEGLGIEYRLPVMKATLNPRTDQVLSTGVGFALFALGVPQGRILTVSLSGVVVCGRSY